MRPYLRPRPEPSTLTFACAVAALAIALGVALAGCGPARSSLSSSVASVAPEAPPSVPPTVGFPPSPERQPPAAHAARARLGAAGRERTWLARDAPAGAREALGAVPGLFEPGDRGVLVAAAPVDLDGDGAPEWLVRADGRLPDLNGRFWAFAERGGRWVELGFLGPAYGALPVGPAPAGGYAPLCRYAFADADTEVAAEFVWAGDHYRVVAAYGLDPEGDRPCEQALFADET